MDFIVKISNPCVIEVDNLKTLSSIFCLLLQISVYLMIMSNYAKMSPPSSPTSSSFSNGDPAQGKQETRLSATAKRQKYLRRILKFKQMDFEYAIWQMIYLFISPQKV